MDNCGEEPTLLEKLHSETAQISWLELQRFFAQGLVIHIDDSLDLVETAVLFARDDSAKLKVLMDSQVIAKPSNDQARDWFDREVLLWSVVVAPFVLVQDRKQS